MVGSEVGQSVETLRSWEKAALLDDDYRAWLDASALAAELETELDTHSIRALEEKYETESFRNSTDIHWAHSALRELRASPLSDIRAMLREARAKKSGG